MDVDSLMRAYGQSGEPGGDDRRKALLSVITASLPAPPRGKRASEYIREAHRQRTAVERSNIAHAEAQIAQRKAAGAGRKP